MKEKSHDGSPYFLLGMTLPPYSIVIFNYRPRIVGSKLHFASRRKIERVSPRARAT